MKKIKAVLIILLIMVAMASCNNKEETPGQAVEKAVEAFSKLDTETLGKYFPGESEELAGLKSESPQKYELMALMLKNLRCKVLAVDESGETALVSAEISNIDLGEVFSEYFKTFFAMAFSQAFSDEQSEPDEDFADQLLMEILERDNNEIHTAIVDIKLYRGENNWILDVVDDEDFEDAVWGGMMKTIGSIDEMF